MTNLKRDLGRVAALGILVGTIIGTGVFLKAAPMTLALGSAEWVMAAWVVAGILSLMGALIYAEIGTLFPEAGGEYIFLREAYGGQTAFLYGWSRFWVGGPGSIAAYAMGSATFLSDGGLLAPSEMKLFALSSIVLLTLLNCLNVRFGGNFQFALTTLKALLLLGLMGALFTLGGPPPASENAALSNLSEWGLDRWMAFGTAVLSALWAYDGWSNLAMTSGELRHPGKTLPFALFFGILAVILLYLGIHAAYFYILPIETIAHASSSSFPEAPSVAAQALTTAFASLSSMDGGILMTGLAIAMTISALGAMNGGILTGARVPFALARDLLLPAFLGRLTPRSAVPIYSVLTQGVIACGLALSGTFDQLTDWVVFAGWIFYGLCGASLILFRRQHPDAPRPFRVPGYPWIPMVFCVASVLLLVNTIVTSPQSTLFGVAFILTGVPVYQWKKRTRRTSEPSAPT